MNTSRRAVSFRNIGLLNGVFVALAPLLLLPIAWLCLIHVLLPSGSRANTSEVVLAAADHTVRRITEQYFARIMTIAEFRELARSPAPIT